MLIQHALPSESADQRTDMLNQTMKLVLSDLDQLILSFSCCYDNEMTHWCAKTCAPQLTGAGVCFKRVHTMLQQFRLVNID